MNLVEHHSGLRAYLARHAGWLLRYESGEDLWQGLQVRLLEHGKTYEYRGREAELKWLYTVARSFLNDRRKYWSRLKRGSAGLLRLTMGATPVPGAAAEPAADATGPSTFAERREDLALAVQALGALPPRDRDIVRWTSEGAETADLAARLGLTTEAARQARHRALERFRKLFRIARGAP